MNKFKFALALIGFGIVLVSGYLTLHFFETRFPEQLSTGSICDLNSFFSCDKATNSELADVAGVPISVFGFGIGILILAQFLFRKKSYEGTLFAVLALNAFLCAGLFAYSLAVLKGLCPFCFLYYLLSIAAFAVMILLRPARTLSPSYAFGMAAFMAVIGFAAREQVRAESAKMAAAGKELYEQFQKMPKVAEPSAPSTFKLADNPGAKIKISVFSDFQCPACKMFSDLVKPLKSRYRDSIDIQYYFYPLDSACNVNSGRIHPFACRAAFVAACIPEKFEQVHDDLFANQEKFSSRWLDEYSEQNGVRDCVDKPETAQKVLALIRAAEPVKVQSTPTWILNGVKLEGALPLSKLIALLDVIAAN